MTTEEIYKLWIEDTKEELAQKQEDCDKWRVEAETRLTAKNIREYYSAMSVYYNCMSSRQIAIDRLAELENNLAEVEEISE